MAPTTFFAALAALALLPCTLAEPKVFGLKFNKVKKSVPQSGLQRRDNTVQEALFNARHLYIANISIGSTAQKMSVQLDTGSSDLWVPSTRSDMCQSPSCNAWGAFDAVASDTYQPLGDTGDFYISYGDNSEYQGNYFADTLTIGGFEVKKMTMAVVTDSANVIGDGSSTDNNGLMGIGFDSNQAHVSRNPGARPFLGVVSQLKKQGLIKSLSYSLWLDDIDALTGAILFGGVDTSKYSGDLIAVPMVGFNPRDEYETVDELAIEMTSVGVTDSEGKTTTLSDSDYIAPALLDSGTTVTYLPTTLLNPILDAAGAVQDPMYPRPLLACNLSTSKGSFVFGFGGSQGPKISIPLSQLVADPDPDPQNKIVFADGTPACPFLMREADDGRIILGDSFLRSAYVVYHLEAKTIALANSNINAAEGTSESDIKEIVDDNIPGIKGKVVPSQPLPTAVPSITAAPTSDVDPFAYLTETQASFDGTLTENPGKASFTAESTVDSNGRAVSTGSVPQGGAAALGAGRGVGVWEMGVLVALVSAFGVLGGGGFVVRL